VANIYLDRNGVPVTCGAHVKMQICVGRYGEVREVRGIVAGIDAYHGVTIKLDADQPRFRQFDRLYHRKHGPGDMFYASPFAYDHAAGVFRGYYRHQDVEHGHERWIEVI